METFTWPSVEPSLDLQVRAAEVEKVKTLSGKVHFRYNTFCQIAYGQPSPDPLTITFYCIFKQQFLQRCINTTQNIFYKNTVVPIFFPNFLHGTHIFPLPQGLESWRIYLLKFKLNDNTIYIFNKLYNNKKSKIYTQVVWCSLQS